MKLPRFGFAETLQAGGVAIAAVVHDVMHKCQPTTREYGAVNGKAHMRIEML